MNVRNRVVQQLEQLVAKGPQEIDAAVITRERQHEYIVGVPAEAGAPGIAMTLTDYDRYSAAFSGLEVNWPAAEAEYSLRQHADRLVSRLDYLEDSLALVEFDPEQKVAQLRSQPAQTEGADIIYWEVMLRAEPQPRATLARYRWRAGRDERERVAYPATFATLGRLAEDLATRS